MKLCSLIAMPLVACLSITKAYTQKPELVKDIYSFTSLNSGIIFGANIGNVSIFSATDGINGQEPWRSDGTAAGTFMLKDILPANNGLNSDVSFALMNGEVYFSTASLQLYKTDGTINGTVLVSTTTGKCNFGFGHTVLNNVLYFSATGTNNRPEPWRTDGTTAGTYRIKDIASATGGSSPAGFTSYNGQVYFTATNPTSGRELWKTDGTDAGTTLVKDIVTGTQSSGAGNLRVLNGWLYFTATEPTTGTELWRTDGTDAGTTLVKDIRAGTGSSSPGILYLAGNQLLFVADDGINGQEIWKSDGSEAGTQLVKDIIPGAVGSQPTTIVAVDNLLYFRIPAANFNIQLWRSDGTSDGTIQLLSTTASSSSYLGNFVTQGSQVFFFAKTNSNPGQLWKSDGTPAGTGALGTDVFPAATFLPVLWAAGNGSIMASQYAVPYGNELWLCTLLPGGHSLVKDINTTNADSDPTNLTRMGNHVYFRATDGLNGITLWKTDGTEAGTTMVVPPGQGTIPLTPSNLFPAGNVLYFNASTAGTGAELWKTDGTIAGTGMVKEIFAGANSGNPQQFCLINGVLYFQANSSGLGTELWKSDGTAAGTALVKDIATGSIAGQPQGLVNVNGTLFFSANNSTSGVTNEFELWKSDGTDAGTVRVKDINVGVQSGGSSPGNLTAFGNLLLFSASNGASNGSELWRSDGTDAGTFMVKDIRLGTTGSTPQTFYTHNGLLYFTANDGTNGLELWRSDGTDAGTTLVRNIFSGSSGSSPRNFASLGNVLLFDAFTSANGTELWKTDGTNAGTVLVKDIYPGANNYTNTTPATRVVAGGKMYFSGSFSATEDGILGFTDGTADGTGKTDPMANGTLLRNIIGMATLDDMIIFDAYTVQYGQELFKYPLSSSPALLTWTGNADTEWSNANNWNPAGLPGPGTEVIIPGAMPRYPVIQANTIIKKITVAQGASVQLASGSVLTVLQ